MATMKNYIDEPVWLLELFTFVVSLLFTFALPVVFCTYYPSSIFVIFLRTPLLYVFSLF